MADNISVYEEEIQNLRQQNRNLKEKLRSSRKIANGTSHLPTDEDNEKVLSKVQDNTVVKNHINALNSAIGSTFCIL